jgi:hypothetical protein
VRPAIPTSGSGDKRVACAADAKWWNSRSFSLSRSSRSGLSAGSGSFSNTSSAAPPIQPSSSAWARAASSTTGPREVFTRIAVFFIIRKRRSSIRWKVGSGDSPGRVRLTCSVTKSARPSAASSGT